MIPLTDPHLLAALSRAAGLECRREAEGVYRVQSGRFPDLFYTVRVSEEGATCNCPAVAHCRHLALAVAATYPEVLTGWLLADCQRIREEWRLAEYKGLRDSRDKIKRELLADIRKLDAGLAKGFAGDEVWRERHGEILEVAA